MKKKRLILDVRDHIQQGREPFPVIMQAVMNLKRGESLLLIAPFKPGPLIQVMTGRGFTHTAVETASGDWEILFEPTEESKSAVKAVTPPPCPKRLPLD